MLDKYSNYASEYLLKFLPTAQISTIKWTEPCHCIVYCLHPVTGVDGELESTQKILRHFESCQMYHWPNIHCQVNWPPPPLAKYPSPPPPSPPPPYISVYWLMCTWGAGGLQAITVMTIHTAANTLLTVLWHFCRNKLTVTTCCIGFKLPLVCQAGQVLCLLDKVQVVWVDCILWWFRPASDQEGKRRWKVWLAKHYQSSSKW